MSCSHVRKNLSSYLDGDLADSRRELVATHLESCPGCAQRMRELRQVSAALAALPRLECQEPFAASILDRVEVESRGPGLALLFRSAFSARPLMVPSVLPAALVAICLMSGILMVGVRDQANAQARTPAEAGASEMDGYLLSSSAGVPTDFFVHERLMGITEQDIFMETFITQDGQVYAKLLEGDSKTALPIMHELTQQRCVPGLGEDGKPMTTRAFRLISAVDVRAPRT
jgi:Putative zinc-finger